MRMIYFLWDESSELGMFMSPEHHEFMESFGYGDTGTWGEFMEAQGEWGAEFVKRFVEWEDPPPQLDDRMQDLGELWIFSDAEFPVSQCAEESFKMVAPALGNWPGLKIVWTEYGEPIGLVPTSDFLKISSCLRGCGIEANALKTPLPDLCDYGRPYGR